MLRQKLKTVMMSFSLERLFIFLKKKCLKDFFKSVIEVDVTIDIKYHKNTPIKILLILTWN